MALFSIRDLTFTYPLKDIPAIKGVNLTVEYGEFITVCGKTGCGKSTLLRNLKTALTPHGAVTGEIYFDGRLLSEIDLREQTQRIGYVLQNPENQIVTDKVWHELAFGLESLGYDTQSIRLRVAEMASFFGIQDWFMKDVSELSGGQKQLLNLAAVMAMQPDLLILDEPSSQLDPIAASNFLETVKKINSEIGTTIIITEHRLEEVLPMSDRAVVLDSGRVILDSAPKNVGEELLKLNHDMFLAMPGPMQIYAGLIKAQKEMGIDINPNADQNVDPNIDPIIDPNKAAGMSCPITVREGRKWLTEVFHAREIRCRDLDIAKKTENETIIELRNVWFKYSRNHSDAIKGLSLNISAGQMHCIVGGNGTGKTTALALIGGIHKPYRGKVKLMGRELSKYTKEELYNGIFGILPQNPQSLFVEKTVGLDLFEVLEKKTLSIEEKEAKVKAAAKLMEIDDLLKMHPYDLSGGEQQRAALGKVLLLKPKIILLDEPTKGLDNHFKIKLAGILNKLLENGITVVMVSHDIEFCAKYGDQCSMFFDGNIITTNTPNRFFSGNSFYTTAANRMSRHKFSNAVTAKDVIDICIQNLKTQES
ncbi:MAG: energy-coupling factor transporter ATPase [Eubacteriales bacterium]|nr:energy-coupling factor transporter ATPase [Eubacteriales bacterium]MDD3199038.1 energy-coupling factor transporter ATPase [Eubacteriales bacterium]MDD4121959.1 energy-coupling factor transporter ATPase [Eubacteriales bacterium]MDD4629476.1 energy-coupling factor transporter ATPase [Eubacteriales bacterium]